MKKYLSLVVALMVTLFTFASFAFTVPEKPANGWYVLDQAGKLTTEQVAQLNTKIEALNKTTKNEYAIVILNTLDGGNIEEAAQDTFRAWGVGKKDLHNGVMIMISTAERKTRIQTGKGAEGDLPDLRCRDILDQKLKPFLKQGKFYEGLDATLNAVSGHMENRGTTNSGVAGSVNVQVPPTPAVNGNSNVSCSTNTASVGGSLLFLFLIGGVAIWFYMRNRSIRKREDAAWAALQDQIEVEQFKRRQQQVKTVPQPVVPLRVTPVVNNPPMPLPTVHYSSPRSPSPQSNVPRPSSSLSTTTKVGLGAVGAIGASTILSEASKRAEEAAKRKRKEDDARKRRDEQEAADRRKRDEESSWNSSSSWGGGSSSYDGGSSFGGGDSGGGGSSSDY